MRRRHAERRGHRQTDRVRHRIRADMVVTAADADGPGLVEHRQRRTDVAGVRHTVRRNETEHLSHRLVDADVRRRRGEPTRVPNQAHAPIQRPPAQHFEIAPVGAPAVDHQDLDDRVRGLRQEAVDARADKSGFIEHGDDHADRGCRHGVPSASGDRS